MPTKTLWTEQRLADQFNISVRTLQAQRQKGEGIPYVKIGRAVRYEPETVENYLAAQRRISTQQEATKERTNA